MGSFGEKKTCEPVQPFPAALFTVRWDKKTSDTTHRKWVSKEQNMFKDNLCRDVVVAATESVTFRGDYHVWALNSFSGRIKIIHGT